MRAFFVDHLASKQAARRFGYSDGSFRVLVHQFRQNPSRSFFIAPAKGPQKAPKSDPLRQEIIQARKQNLSVYDIHRLLQDQGHSLSTVSISLILILRRLPPAELIFDSKLTTYANLNRLNTQQIHFTTLRRRSQAMLHEVGARPLSAWRQIHLENISRIYRTPRILDERIELRDYAGPIRQIVVSDLGHEEPTFLLTNQLKASPAKLIGRYAKRMIIENNIQDGIDFFHMDALSSAVAMKVDCDLQLTLMASSLYRLFALEIGQGYERAKSRTLFQDFINASATTIISSKEIVVRFQKRAHNPLLLKAGFDKREVKIPWLQNRRLRFVFG